VSANDYAATPTDRLLRLFAETAQRTGLGRAVQPGGAAHEGSVPTKAEKKLAFATSAAIAEALRGKATKRDVEPLFDSSDPDIRLCAAMLLSDFAPELAEAAQQGVIANRPTGEIVASKRRARTPPPSRPTLAEMGDDELLARFEDAAERQTACRFLDWTHDEQDMATRNAIIEDLARILGEMKRRGALAKLLPFLNSTTPIARFRAAQGCLRIAPERAVATLEAIAATGSLDDRIAAANSLDRWRKGESLIDKL